MFKMGSHCSFGHLKCKLWSKEGLARPLKVRNRPDLLSYRWCVTYRWKVLDKSYNSASDLISIGGLFAKLWRPKIIGIPTWAISGLPFGVLGQKAIWMWVPWVAIEYTIRGKMLASPKSKLWWVLCVCVVRDSSSHQRCSNYALNTLCWFCVGLCE
jgi:hypothetical protein